MLHLNGAEIDADTQCGVHTHTHRIATVEQKNQDVLRGKQLVTCLGLHTQYRSDLNRNFAKAKAKILIVILINALRGYFVDFVIEERSSM